MSWFTVLAPASPVRASVREHHACLSATVKRPENVNVQKTMPSLTHLSQRWDENTKYQTPHSGILSVTIN